MSKKSETKKQKKSCEVIELAIDNVDLLTRTFRTIASVCEKSPNAPRISSYTPQRLIN